MANINNIKVDLSALENNFTAYLTKIQQQILLTRNTVNIFNETVAATKNKLKMADYNAYASALLYSDKALQSLGKSGMVFDQSLANLAAQTGIIGANLDALSVNARKMGVSSGLGANQALKAYQVLASQVDVSKVGLEGLNVLQEKTLTLAKASGMEVEGVAMALSGTIAQFGLEADQAGRVMNVLAAGARYGSAGIPELSQALEVVGTMAQSTGMEVESAAGALEVLSRNNLKGAAAGDALKEIMQGMQASLGIDFQTTSLSSALEALKPQLNDAAFLTKAFGEGNVATAQYLISNAAAVQEMTAKLTDSNVAQEQAEVRGQSVAGKMEKMQAWIDNAKYSLFEMTGGFSGYLGILGEAMGGIANFIPLLGLLNQMRSMSTVVTNMATLAQLKLNLAFLASPLTWIVLTIGALVGAIVWVCSKITDWGNLWNGIVGMMKYSFFTFVDGVKLYWSAWINSFMIGINYILKGWYHLKNMLGIGDEEENNAELARLDADTDARKQNLKAGAKKVASNLWQAKESLTNIRMGWGGNEGAEDEGRPVAETGTTAGPGLISAGIPGTDNASRIPIHQTTSPALVQQSSGSALGGGTRGSNITISLGKLMDNVNIYAQEFRDGLNDLDNQVLESLTRVLNMAQSNAV